MLTMISICALTAGGGDIYAYLSQGDYYSENEQVAGYWNGSGAKRLGLSGEVNLADFEKIMAGQNQEGRFLRPRHSEIKGRDLCVAMPKSASVLAYVGGDKRIEFAHLDAVQEVIKHIEKEATAEVQKGGKRFERKTGSLVAAVFTHRENRLGEAHGHSHIACSNLTFDAEEKRWKALHASKLYERKALLTEIYRNTLAKNLMALGYELETVSTGRGNRDRAFEIVGVSKELRTKFSEMSENIKKAVAEKEKHQTVTAKEERQIGLDIRPKKVHRSAETLESLQQAKLTGKDKSDLAAVREKAKANEGRPVEKWSAATSVFHALDHCTDRQSVAKEHEVIRQALIHGRGHVSVEEIEKSLAALKKQGTILKQGNDIATRQSLEREKNSIWMVDQGVNKFERLDRGKTFEASENFGKLNQSQKAAVNSILASRDGITSLRGAAGVGKTRVLGVICERIKETGQEVIALAPTSSAVKELQKVGLDESKIFTLQKMLQDPHAVENMRGKLIVLDEAGMVDFKQGFELLRLGKEANARILFSGDTKQLQSVGAGDFLRVLETKSSLAGRTHELTEIVRQKDSTYRFAMELFRTHPREAFEVLEAMGCVKEVKPGERAAAIAAELKQKPGALILGTTHAENDRINEAVRVSGEEAQKLTRMVPLNFTEAEKRHVKNFEPGHWLLFHKATQEGKIENAYCVTGVTGRFVETVDLEGNPARFSQKQAKAFGVFEKKEFSASVGDKLVFNANAKQAGFEVVNGQQAQIASFNEKGRPVLANGQTVPETFLQMNLGYAITVHKSQGKSEEHVISSADSMTMEQAYVAWSRAEKSLVIYTTDKEALKLSIGISGERPAALDLEAEISAAAALQPPSLASEVEERRARQKKQSRQDVEINGSIYRWREEDGYHEIDHSCSAWLELTLEHNLEGQKGGR